MDYKELEHRLKMEEINRQNNEKNIRNYARLLLWLISFIFGLIMLLIIWKVIGVKLSDF
ncbi:hypothetical protein [Paenibacillus sp. FSL P4-0502]|uniref:hypothetical protein n=1 Tax=Paenibacillus sp. FSL P4-0502 TaxID=2975319 RepID=UPI0030F7F0EE